MIDLTEAAKTLPFEGQFRDMVLEAARRKLVKRGAIRVIIPPSLPRDTAGDDQL